VGADDLYKSIRHVYKLGASRPRVTSQAAESEASKPAKSTSRGQLIAVFSPKGGVGTSVIAANMAVALRQYTNKKVALVDANLSLGDQNVILNLLSNTTIVDLAKRIADLDRDLMNDVLATHTSQVKVLLAPPNPQEGETVTADHVRTVLNLMCQEFDYVVVDTHSSFQDRTLAVLDDADRIVLIMTLEMPCIKNIKLFLEVAELLGYPGEKLLLVLNKADARLGIRVENVENNIQHKVSLQIGNAAHEMTLSINQGVPLVIGKREHRVARDIFALAREVSGIAQSDSEEEEEEEEISASRAKKGLSGLGFFKRLLTWF
jgi:pilus assembly protein CpaE